MVSAPDNPILIDPKTILSGTLRSWILRGIFSIVLISYLMLTVYWGPIWILLTTLVIQIKCCLEIINIGHKVYPVNEPPFFKFLSWYFLLAANYFCYGETLVDYFQVYINKHDMLRLLVNYHRFISFSMYLIGMIGFILSLRTKYDKHQFSLLAWTHVSLLLVVTQSYMIVKTLFQGMIWIVLPTTLVACNDIFSFIFGKLFGATPLIKVSPKKTWEGFVGGAVCTVLYGYIASYIMCQYPYLTCPMEYVETANGIQWKLECGSTDLFKSTEYTFDFSIFDLIEVEMFVVSYPFILHAFVFSLFASLIAPFGGFFASGFKRAFHVKDFGETIPGHGGVLDRFDCQFLMAAFVNVYIETFVKTLTPRTIFQKISYLDPENQMQFYYLLKSSLEKRNLG